jgi:nicotinamidase-related amidase
MSHAPLDPRQVAVLFADLQAGIVERTATQEAARLRRAVAALAKLAKLLELPVIVTTAPGDGGAHVIPEITTMLPDAPLHTRTTTDAFTHAPTREAVAQANRKTLLIAGVATEIIVQHSALSAVRHGYDVQVVVDACSGISSRTEDAALRRLTQAGVVLTSMPSVAGQLAGDFSQPIGQEVLRIMYELAS